MRAFLNQRVIVPTRFVWSVFGVVWCFLLVVPRVVAGSPSGLSVVGAWFTAFAETTAGTMDVGAMVGFSAMLTIVTLFMGVMAYACAFVFVAVLGAVWSVAVGRKCMGSNVQEMSRTKIERVSFSILVAAIVGILVLLYWDCVAWEIQCAVDGFETAGFLSLVLTVYGAVYMLTRSKRRE